MVSAENLEVDSSPKRCHGKGNGEVVFQEWRQRSEELSNPIPRGTRARAHAAVKRYYLELFVSGVIYRRQMSVRPRPRPPARARAPSPLSENQFQRRYRTEV